MRWVPAGLVAALLALPVNAAPTDPAPKEPPPTIDELVADLSAPLFRVREKAQRDLWLRGEAAIPALEKVAGGDDPEAARRARELLDKFAWGLRPDTPADVLKLIRQFQAGDPNPERADAARKEAVAELLKKGRAGVSVVSAILRKDLPAESREKLAAAVTATVRRAAPLLLVAGRTDEANELVDLHVTGTSPEGAADFAAYHALRGDLPAATARAEALARTGRGGAGSKLVLTYLYRAAGLWAKAREAAANLSALPEEATYKEILLEDEGNWAALADTPAGRIFNHPEAVRLTLLRLAGRTDAFADAAKKLRADADEFTEDADIMDAAVALLANHRADAATDLLQEKRRHLGLLSEIFIARMRYRTALDLIGTGKKEKETVNAAERLDFNLRRARVLMMTGHKDDAIQVFNGVAHELNERYPPAAGQPLVFSPPARALVRTELRVGLRDLACEHASMFVTDGGNFVISGSAGGESPFELLFPHDPVAGQTLFAVLRAAKVPGDASGTTMIRTRDLLAGAAGAAAVDQALGLLRAATGALPGDGGQPDAAPGTPVVQSAQLLKARHYLTLATVCRAAKRGGDAEAAYKRAAELTATATDAADATGARSWVYGAPDPARVWIEWGTLLSDAGRPREAAGVLEAGWKLFPDQPLPLYLSGRALLAAGDAKEGEHRARLSHWVSLGNEKVRGRFLDELVRRGEAAAIRREVALILKACWSRDHFFGNVMNQCSRGAALVGDFALAETCGQRSLLVVMRTPDVYFVDPSSYLNVPHDLLIFHTRALLGAGKVDEAMAAARAVLAVTPGHLDFVTGMVPELDRRGKKKEADELFDRAWAAHQAVLADYPDSPSARHALAVLAGHCRRKLDDGSACAKAAVAADPLAPAYREALAEVHFRRGERDAALKLMQALADESPRSALYRRQLARYRAAAFDSPWPYTAE